MKEPVDMVKEGLIKLLNKEVRRIEENPNIVESEEFEENYMNLCRQLMMHSIDTDYRYNDYVCRFYTARELK